MNHLSSGADVQEGEDYIYGRGCIDDKHSVIGILIALGMSLSTQKKETLKRCVMKRYTF
jgi:acetylornithine deacetylase/succinyl-diaminopimelate desuccinylase-like protein